MKHKKKTGSTSEQRKMFQEALVLHRSGQLDLAETKYKKLLNFLPNNIDLLTNLGTIALQKGKLEEGVKIISRSLLINPNQSTAHNNCGNALKELKRFDEALASYDRAIELKLNDAEVYSNRGLTLQELKKTDEALASYDRAISLKPDYADAYFNRGITLHKLNRLDKALASFNRAIELKSNYAEAYFNRANVLRDLKELNKALESYDRAISLKPDYADAYFNRGITLHKLNRLDKALTSFNRAIELKLDIDFLLSYSLFTKMKLCIWDDLSQRLNELTKKIINNEKAALPFSMLALIDEPEIQKKTNEIYVKKECPTINVLPKIKRYPKHSKIRIGYFSADFHNHATMHLMAELFERHDKKKFELIAFSFGPDKKDEWRQRVLLCFDQFVDVRLKSDQEISLLARKMEIDIAIDLKGFTRDSRPNIFAEGSAPIQVSYLGYPCTMAADYIDYLIADSILIPEEKQQHYSEKIVYMPNSYQVNVSKRNISETSLMRHEFGLPNTGFVFCCFNNNYKITPTIFAGWMRILKAVENSVLWLFESNKAASKNLKKEAKKFGINEDRLVFATYTTVEEHLNRIKLADLFIDTLPYNAHTTTSDALRMGLPVLTCIGNTFASRVAASLLNAVNLPELITNTQEQYESFAIKLAMHPEKLNTIKEKLIKNLPTAALYDTQLFVRHLESAYLSMYDRYQKGLNPDHIYVEH
jgi:predicted O-linked N-acetylglucosamine transferase (SPINDLY family)